MGMDNFMKVIGIKEGSKEEVNLEEKMEKYMKATLSLVNLSHDNFNTFSLLIIVQFHVIFIRFIKTNFINQK
jgi:hypothetical protein